jgi:hypothetical protein
VAICDVALTFPLAVIDFGAPYTPTVRGVVAHRREAATIARFQHDRLRQRRPATIDGLQLRIGGCGLQACVHRLFQGVDLLPQAVHNGQTTGDSQDVLGRGQHALEGCRRELDTSFGTEACTGVARHKVLDTADLGGVLPHQVRAFAQYIAYGPLSLWVDGPCR